jgi:hypothetical protein
MSRGNNPRGLLSDKGAGSWFLSIGSFKKNMSRWRKNLVRQKHSCVGLITGPIGKATGGYILTHSDQRRSLVLLTDQQSSQ